MILLIHQKVIPLLYNNMEVKLVRLLYDIPTAIIIMSEARSRSRARRTGPII